jgi:hypothetical protein
VIQGIAYSNKKRSCLKHILYVDKFYHFFKWFLIEWCKTPLLKLNP